MSIPSTARFEAVLLPPDPAPGDLHKLTEPYQAIIATQLRAILDRTERSEYYPWIDTKINLLTGDELPARDPLLGRDVVSGWVQGRGLETVARFAGWSAAFPVDRETNALIERARRLAADLLQRLREARNLNSGRLHFFMTTTGRAFVYGPDGARCDLALGPGSPYGYSDLFGAKGMYAAAHLLGDTTAQKEARSFCLDVYRDILARTFRSDQPQPATGARAWIEGAYSHGPAMIALGMARLFAEHEPSAEAVALGLALARYVLDTHVNLDSKWPDRRECDLVEYVDEAGRPFKDESGILISDPGHSLEFVGLFLQFSRAAHSCGRATASQLDALRDAERRMPLLLSRAFENGFRPEVGGICKTVDLITRCPVDSTMPWWSLPETIRAALGAWSAAASDESRRRSLQILAAAHNAFVSHYVRPEIHLMAVKVRDMLGRAVDAMPAYPDADPGYHTALCLIDALDSASDICEARAS
jgi:mannose/cellobiose epimerase-like protein (N-acyl-D-glucosamine 2-epimerase family)